MKADVAIIIVSYNSAEFIGDCLESVFSQCDHVTQQVIVVDNASKDNTVEVLQPYVHRLAHFQSARDQGQSDAINSARW